MDEIQEKYERWAGDSFVEWYNNMNGSRFSYVGRPNEAPDLIYEENKSQLVLEIGGAYSGPEEAAFWWKNIRKRPDAPKQFSSKDMDESLISDINKRIQEKCSKSYGPDCLLIIYLHPAMTTAEELQEMLSQIRTPLRNPFRSIFLTGHFPVSSSGSIGGYRCWQISSANSA